MSQRDDSGQFVKGISGNPGGRPKDADQVRALCRDYTIESIQMIVEIMRNPKAQSKSRFACAKELLDRGWGKPKETIDHGITNELAELLKAIDGQTRGLPTTPLLPHHRNGQATH
jgi:inosine/xanthosine triphosphate pyrophosphatase family protein